MLECHLERCDLSHPFEVRILTDISGWCSPTGHKKSTRTHTHTHVFFQDSVFKTDQHACQNEKVEITGFSLYMIQVLCVRSLGCTWTPHDTPEIERHVGSSPVNCSSTNHANNHAPLFTAWIWTILLLYFGSLFSRLAISQYKHYPWQSWVGKEIAWSFHPLKSLLLQWCMRECHSHPNYIMWISHLWNLYLTCLILAVLSLSYNGCWRIPPSIYHAINAIRFLPLHSLFLSRHFGGHHQVLAERLEWPLASTVTTNAWLGPFGCQIFACSWNGKLGLSNKAGKWVRK